MKPLEENEIFQNLSGFLKSRGIELKDGVYAQGVQKSCALLTQAINLGQESFERAKAELDKTLDHVRQTIHEKTAPRTGGRRSRSRAARPGKTRPSPGKAGARARKAASRRRTRK